MVRRSKRQTEIKSSDLADYGSVANGTVNVDRAALGLGASKTRVQQALRKAQAAQSNTFFRRISGREEADPAQRGSVRGMLQAVFGKGPRGGAVNTKAAAHALGVSQGTVRRWAAGTQKPAPDRLAQLDSDARRMTTTKAGRRAAIADFRANDRGRQALLGGSKIWIAGEQGVGGYDQGYARDRRVATDIDPEELEAMLRAYEDGGDSGLREWMQEFFDDQYVAGWDFVTIDDFGIGTPE